MLVMDVVDRCYGESAAYTRVVALESLSVVVRFVVSVSGSMHYRIAHMT